MTTEVKAYAALGVVGESGAGKSMLIKTIMGLQPAGMRVDGRIGAPLDAEVTLYGTPAWTSALKPLGDELRFVLITSEARVADADTRPPEALATDGEGNSGLWLHVKRSESQKCARCWHRRPDVGTLSAHPELCGRCVVNLYGPGETRQYV